MKPNQLSPDPIEIKEFSIRGPQTAEELAEETSELARYQVVHARDQAVAEAELENIGTGHALIDQERALTRMASDRAKAPVIKGATRVGQL